MAGRHIVRSSQLIDFAVSISQNDGVQFPVVRANRHQNVSGGENLLSQSPHCIEVQFSCGFRELRRLQTLHFVDDEQAEAARLVELIGNLGELTPFMFQNQV